MCYQRPLRLGLVSPAREPKPEPEPEPEVSRFHEHDCPDVRLSVAELEEVAELSAAEQLALEPPPVQPGQREILQLEVEALVRAEQRVRGGQYCVAAAQRLQLQPGDSLVAPSPAGEYRVTIGPDEQAEPGDMDLLEIAAKQFDGSQEIEGVDGVAAVSCRISISCVGHAFRAGLRLQIPHCARSTVSVTALWGVTAHGPWQVLPQGCSLSFSTAAGEEVGEIYLGEDPGPCWVVLVRGAEHALPKDDDGKEMPAADASVDVDVGVGASAAQAAISAPSGTSGAPSHAAIEPEDVVYIVVRPVDRPAPLIDTDDLDGPEQEIRREQTEMEHRPDTAHGGSSARPPTAVEGPNGIRSALASVYRCHNPAKLAEVDALLEDWRGSELELLDHVRQKYDPASNRLRFPVDSDVSIVATMGPLLSELDTAGALAVYGPFNVCRGVWYTLKMNLGPSGANRIASGPSPAAGVFLPVQQKTEPQRYLAARRTEFVLQVRARASPSALALSKQLMVCNDLRRQLAALTPRNEDMELPPEAVSVKLSIPGADKIASGIREQREAELAMHALPTDFLDGLILEACSATAEPRYYCQRCRKMFTPWPGRIKCDDCGQLATRKQVARTGIRLTEERVGVCNGSPEPEWAATLVAEQRREIAAAQAAAIEEEKRQRAAALAAGAGAGSGAGAAAGEAADAQRASKSCTVS